MSLHSFLRTLFAPLMRVVFRIHTHGAENIPSEGALMVCSNHICAADVIFISASVKKREIRYMAKAEVFRIPVLKHFLTAMGAFPIKRGEGDVGAIKKTIKLLRNGETVGIFPQGTRCAGRHPRESEVKPGAGMIAWRAHSDVLPVAIITKNYKFALFRRIDVIIGKPVSYNDLGFEKGNHEEQVAATNIIFDEILKLHDKGVPPKC
ncbi:MAG: 1-acyl-sn-glycerol-3-phosphate acyltransferase [Clostridia bacterium]|nr:1-acyl-sn-glycerol-3-phosphate acyltransferase [Clostridia bacterium]